MDFFKHRNCNHSFGPPPGVSGDDCGTLHVHSHNSPGYGPCHTSFWRPTANELATLNDGGSVALTVYGRGHPMVSLAARTRESENV